MCQYLTAIGYDETWTRSIESRCCLRIQQSLHCPLRSGSLTKVEMSENQKSFWMSLFFSFIEFYLNNIGHIRLRIYKLTATGWECLSALANISHINAVTAAANTVLATLRDVSGVWISNIKLSATGSQCQSVLANIPNSTAAAMCWKPWEIWQALNVKQKWKQRPPLRLDSSYCTRQLRQRQTYFLHNMRRSRWNCQNAFGLTFSWQQWSQGGY